MTTEKFLDIVKTMIEYGMLDSNRLFDTDYIIERVKMYLKARSLAIETMKMSGIPL